MLSYTLSPQMEIIYSTFLASIRSVGTACTMALVGVYLHRCGCVSTDGKRTLAVISQQVTVPLLLFTKIIYCNQDWSDKPCPDVTKALVDVWMLVLWPIYVVGAGIFVGWIVARLTNTPKHQTRTVLAACGFANSTGLPITLLMVVHSNFPKTSDLGAVDPTLFLSVYLLLYPVLQWGLGGWMLAPEAEERTEELNATSLSTSSAVSESFRHNVLNNQLQDEYYRDHRRGLSSADEGLYMTEIDLPALLEREERLGLVTLNEPCSPSKDDNAIQNYRRVPKKPSIDTATGSVSEKNGCHAFQHTTDERNSLLQQRLPHAKADGFDAGSIWQTIRKILDRCVQPPVVGAVLGILCATTPARAWFVDLVDRDSDAPLQWLFDGLYSVGLAAVPVNMMILGCNLSASFSNAGPKIDVSALSKDDGLLPMKTMIGIVIGKMIVLPAIGILTGYVLKNYLWHLPEDIGSSVYLVVMIVFLTPTANNVMVMIELSGSGAKEGMARVIALQYAIAPVLLSLSMTVAIGVASGWSY